MANLQNPMTLGRARNPNQNLISQVSFEDASKPKWHYFGIFLEIFSVAAAIALSYFYRRYLLDESSLVPAAFFGSVFGVLQSITFILSRSVGRRALILVVKTLGLLSAFIYFPNLSLLQAAGIALVVFFFLYWGEREGRIVMENSMAFKFFRVTRPLLGKTISALVLLGVLLSLPQISISPNFLSSNGFFDISGWTATLTQKIYPGIGKEDTVEGIARKLAEMQLENSGSLDSLDAATRTLVINRTTDEIIKNFSSQSGVALNEQESFRSFISQFISSKLSDWYSKAPRTFLAVWAVLLFFIFRGFGAVLAVVIAFIAYLVYQVLLATNVIHIVGESRLHETVECS